ncbi:hypothetical protein ABPG74_000192 [Tetrahymena malaccensis]
MIAAKDLAQMLVFGTIDEGINFSLSLLNKVQSKASFLFPEKRDTNANLLRQFSLQWIIHNVPLKDGIQMSYEEFRSAIKRFSRYYNENSLEQQLKDFYDTAVNVWQKFKQPPSTEEIKHALLEIAAKTLDKDLQKKEILKSDVGFGEGLFKIAKELYEEKKQMSENSLIKNVFESFEGILEKEKHYVEVCKDYYSFLKDFINVHFPTKQDKKNERFYKKIYKFTFKNYLKLVSFPLYTLEDVIDLFLSESTQNIVANNFREKRSKVQNNQVQQLQLQIQILGIKGFLIWKRFYNSYKVYRGFSLQERVQLLGLYGLLNEVKLLIPVFNQDSIRIKKVKEFYEVKVKKTLIQHYKQIVYYHGIIKKEWVIFKIKTLNQIKDMIKSLQIKVEQVNHRANKLYQEALDYVQNKRRQILLQSYEDTKTQENEFYAQEIQEEKPVLESEDQINQGVASPVVNDNSSNDNSYNEEEEKNDDNHQQVESRVMEKVAESAQELEGSYEDSQIKSGNQSQIKKNDSVDLFNQNQQQVISSEEDNPAVTQKNQQ